MAKTSKYPDAEDLYNLGFTQKRIAELLDVSQQTVCLWAKQGNWASKKAERMARKQAKEDRINALIEYDLEVMEQFVDQQRRENPEALKPLDKGVVDSVSKLFQGVKGKELHMGQIYNLTAELLKFIGETNPELADSLGEYTDSFFMRKKAALAI